MAVESSPYDNQLIDLGQQADLLRGYNANHWGNFFNERDFLTLEQKLRQVSYGAQTLGKVATIHAEFESPLETLKRWRDIYFGDLSGLAHWNSLYLDGKNAARTIRLHEHAQQYEPGLHVVTVDMAHGQNIRGTVADIRAAAIEQGNPPAQAEILSVMGLQKALRKNHDRTTAYAIAATPYLAGYELVNPYAHPRHTEHVSWHYVPQFDYGQGSVGLRAFSANTPHIGTIPVITHQEDRIER